MHLTRIITILLFSTVLCTNSQAKKQNDGDNFYVENRNFCDTISAVFSDDGIILPIEIDGKMFRFRFNTGSVQGSLFSKSGITGAKEVGNVVSSTEQNGNDTTKIVALPSLLLGKTKIYGYLVALKKDNDNNAEYDGEIGFDIINKGLLMKIDRHAGQIIITDIPDFFKQETGFDVNYELKWFLPYTLISPFKRHVDRALFNTSVTNLYSMGKQSFDIHAYKSKNVGHQVEGTAKGIMPSTEGMQEYSVVFLNLDRLKWDKFAFTKVAAITNEGSSNIGTKILDYGTIIINPLKRSMTFEPYNKADSVVVGNRLPGVAIVNMHDKPMVSLIFNKSNAYKSGLRRGDIITEVNGNKVNDFTDFRRIKFNDGSAYKLSVLRSKGKTAEIFLNDGLK